MISNQILQNTIDGLKTIARVDFEVLDTEGKEVATTAEVPFGGRAEAAEFVKSQADSQEIQGCQFFKIYDDQQPEYVLVTIGSDENAYLVGKMAAFQIQNLMIAYKERFDKDNFVKNLLLDNLLLIDIYSRAKKLHMLRSFLGVNSLDFITAVDERDGIVVKDLSEGDGVKEIEKAAKAMESFLKKEGMTGIRVAYGTVVKEIKEVSRSYKEAKMAMDVGKIFFDDRSIIAYSQLGIGRLIYQLPIPLCKMFIKEIFGDKSPDDFDEETLTTIQKFFENSLNVSETSRQLFIHRNTLVYRLDKLQKTTGLDLRIFEDAITFRIALMVVKYMNFMENFEY